MGDPKHQSIGHCVACLKTNPNSHGFNLAYYIIKGMTLCEIHLTEWFQKQNFVHEKEK